MNIRPRVFPFIRPFTQIHPFTPPQPRTLVPRTLHSPTRHAALASTLRAPATPIPPGPRASQTSTALFGPYISAVRTLVTRFTWFLSRPLSVQALIRDKNRCARLLADRAVEMRLKAAHTMTYILSRNSLPPSVENFVHFRALAALRAHPNKVDKQTTIGASQALGPNLLVFLPSDGLLSLSQFLMPAFWVSPMGTLTTRVYVGSKWLGIDLDACLRLLIRRKLVHLSKVDHELYAANIASREAALTVPPYSPIPSEEQVHAACRARGIDLVCSNLHGQQGSGARGSALCSNILNRSLRTALFDWADLHVLHGVSPLLLVLSSAVVAAQFSTDLHHPTYTAANENISTISNLGPPVGRHLEWSALSDQAFKISSHEPRSPHLLHSGIKGYAACLHALLTHVPGGLDVPHRLAWRW